MPHALHEVRFRAQRRISSAPRLAAWLACIALALALIMPSAPAKAGSADEEPVDVALVLAVDISFSMTMHELALQRDGYVTAFRDPRVHAAIAAGPHQRIAVSYMEWAGAAMQ